MLDPKLPRMQLGSVSNYQPRDQIWLLKHPDIFEISCFKHTGSYTSHEAVYLWSDPGLQLLHMLQKHRIASSDKSGLQLWPVLKEKPEMSHMCMWVLSPWTDLRKEAIFISKNHIPLRGRGDFAWATDFVTQLLLPPECDADSCTRFAPPPQKRPVAVVAMTQPGPRPILHSLTPPRVSEGQGPVFPQRSWDQWTALPDAAFRWAGRRSFREGDFQNGKGVIPNFSGLRMKTRVER